MSTFETEQPCGCVVITDDSPVTINGADMRGIVANFAGVRRCAAHQAEWDAGIKRFSDAIDKKIAEKVYGEFYPKASAQGDGAGE